MKKVIRFLKSPLILSIAIMLNSNLLQAQLVYNNGTIINAKDGVVVFVDGSVQNETGEIIVDENGGLNAELIIQEDFINNSTSGGDGYYRVLGDWINNNIFNAGSGTVFLPGSNQLITGSVSTYFNNLTLEGTGLKTQTIDQYVTGILNLNDLELRTESFGMFVESTDLNAIIRTTGFVSSLGIGFLSRNTSLANTYLYPVGSSVGVNRYRPVEITPNDALANTYTVRMANVDATIEGFDRSLVEEDICETNELFYHRINQTIGTSAIDLRVYFDETVDGNWDGLAHWTLTPDEWNIVTGSSSTPGAPLSYAFVNNWNDFSQTPYILYNMNPQPVIDPAGPICENDDPITLNADIPGGTWSGNGITDANAGTFDPGAAAIGNNTITYTVTVGTCTSMEQIVIEVIESPDPTITDPGEFCEDDLAVILTAATLGGTWSGTGITDPATGEFDPTVAGQGNHDITYTVMEGICEETNQITITVYELPDATITNPGDFCEDDPATILTAAAGGGTWSGNGITNPATGAFDPAVAGVGNHTITYTVINGECEDTDQIILNVYAVPVIVITPVADLCSEDAAVTLNATPLGGTWSGDGVVGDTFDPTHASANIGINTITYEVTVSGCTNSDQIDITVIEQPELIITNVYCAASLTEYIVEFTNSIGIISTTAGTIDGLSIIDIPDGVDITITSNNNGCISQENIIAPDCSCPAIPAPTNPQHQEICHGEPTPALSVDDPGVNYQINWYTQLVGGTELATATNSYTPTNTNPGVYNYYAEVEEIFSNCKSPRTTVTLTIFANPEILGDLLICGVESSNVLTGSGGSGTPHPTTAWESNDPTTVSVVDGTVTGEAIGSATITYMDSNGCIAEELVEVRPLPVIGITPIAALCSEDASADLEATPIGGTWSGDGVVGDSFDPTHASANIGNNTITYEVTVDGCTDSDQILIEVIEQPELILVATDCSGDLLTYTVEFTNSIGTISADQGTVAGNTVTLIPIAETVTITSNNNGCISELIVTPPSCDCDDIDEPTNPVNQQICEGSPAIAISVDDPGAGNQINWYDELTGGNLVQAASNSYTPADIDPGVYTYYAEVEEIVTGCVSDRIPVNFTIFENPSITGDISICGIGGTTVLLGTGGSGTPHGTTPWTSDNTGIATVTNGTVTATGIGTTDITFMDSNGCTTSETIEVIANPVVDITDAGPFCDDDAPVNLTATPIGGTWSGDGITDPANGTFDASVAGDGTHIITYEVSVAGCDGSGQISIQVFSSPDATITPAGPFCEDDVAVTLEAVSAGGTWSGDGITNPATGLFDPSVAGDGDHIITYDIGVGSCADSDQITITVFELPDATINPAGPFCEDDAPVNLTAATAGGTWSGTGITDASNGTFNPAIAGEGSHLIFYEVEENGCTSTHSITIDVLDNPDATITPAGPFCEDDAPVNLTATTTGGTWSGTGITDASNGTFDPADAGEGSHIITYNVGSGSCSDSDQITIIVNAIPAVSITAAGPFCDNDDPVNLEANPVGGTWSGTGITDANAGTFDPSDAGEGAHIITYSLTVEGCSGSDQITINVLSTPDASITAAGPFCDTDDPVVLEAGTEGGTWSGTGITNPATGSFNPQTAGAGNHIISYTVGVGVCTDSDQITITIYETPDATITPVGPFCFVEGDTIALEAATVDGIWSGTGIVDQNNGAFHVGDADIGANIISYTVTEGICSDEDQITITVYENANATIFEAGPFCDSDSLVELYAVTAGGIWTGTGITNENDGIFDIAQAGPGVHEITYTIAGDCGDEQTLQITVHPTDFIFDYELSHPRCISGTDGYMEIFVSGGTAPYTFEWDENGFSNTEYISGLGAGQYTITLIDFNGCMTEIADVIILDGEDDCIEIPNAFTPNGDGINDEWIINNINAFPEHFIQVYNRWGQEIYSARHGEPNWDGTYNGKQLPTGSYIYVVQLDETSNQLVGIVTIVR
jgi:trimeric autotransporter adhesin